MTDNFNDAPKPETASETPFVKIAEVVSLSAQLFPDYYRSGAKRRSGAAILPTGVSEETQILTELDEAKTLLESGHPMPEKTITLYAGIQARHSEHSGRNEGHRIVEHLYEALSGIAGTGMSTYYDLENQAKALKAENRYMVDGSKFRFRVREWPQLAITNENEELRGIQMRLADNIFATFYLPNFGRPDEVLTDGSRVEINVVPGTAAKAI